MRKERAKTGDLRSLFLQGRPIFVQKGASIIKPGDIYGKIYYIEDGFVKTYIITSKGERKILLIFKAGEFFPLFILAKSYNHDIYYEAVTECSFRTVSRRAFVRFLESNPYQATRFLSGLGIFFEAYIDRIKNLGLTSARSRIAQRLFTLTKRFGEHSSPFITINAPITHEIIADSVNSTRETVSREMARLEKDGVVKYEGRLIVVCNLQKLQSLFSLLLYSLPLIRLHAIH